MSRKIARLPIKRSCPPLDLLMDDFLAEKGVSCYPATIVCYRASISLFAQYMADTGLPDDVTALTKKDIMAYVAYCRTHKRLKDSTILLRFTQLKTFLTWLQREQIITDHPMLGLDAPHVGEQVTPYLEQDAFARLLRTCQERTFTNIRDRAILMLAVDTGIRKSGIQGLKMADIDLQMRRVIVHTAKGGHEYYATFGKATAAALRAYRRERETHPESLNTDAWWLGKFGAWGRCAFQDMVRKRARMAGLEQRVYMHLFRHTFAHNLRMSGASDKTVMTLGNWKSWKSYNRYAQAGAQAEAMANYASPVDRLLGE